MDPGKTDGDFGDFQEGPTAPKSTFVPAALPTQVNKMPEDDPFASIDKPEADDGFGDFGDFEAAPEKEEPAAEQVDNFGDFGDFEQAPTEATNVAAAPQMDSLLGGIQLMAPVAQEAPATTTAAEDDGFGDFGDFEEAPQAEPVAKQEPATNLVEDDPFAEILGEYGIKDATAGADEAVKAAESAAQSQPEAVAAPMQLLEANT